MVKELSETEEPDILVVCGDLTNMGSSNEVRLFLDSYRKVIKNIYIIPGNCDFIESFNDEYIKRYNIHGKWVVYNKYVFLGIGGSPYTPFGMPFEFDDSELEEIAYRTYYNIPKELKERLIVVSHTPPKGTKVDKIYIGLHVGSDALRKFILDVKPLLVISGHIHEGKGTDELGSTIIVNPGPASRGYYAIVNIVKERINVRLGRWISK